MTFETIFANELTNGFYIAIAATLLFFVVAELRLSTRYRKGLVAWKELRAMLQGGNIDVDLASLSTKLKALLHQFFVIEESLELSDSSNAIRLAKSNDHYMVTVPTTTLVPHQPTSPYRFVPALLTTIGVLGTFLGISLGLADFQSTGSGSTELMNSATKLLEGMKTAFYTSLAGLLGSILFMAWHAALSKGREMRHRSLSLDFQQLCIAQSPVALLHKLNPANQKDLLSRQLAAADATIQSNHQLASVVSDLGDVFNRFDSDTIANSVSKAVSQSVEKEIAPHLASISENIKELRDIKIQSAKQVVDLIVTSLRSEVVEPFAEQSREISQQTSAMCGVVESSSASLDRLSEKLDDMMNGLESTTGTLNQFQMDTLTKLQQFAESLRTILSQFKDDTEGALNRVAEEIQHALDNSIEGMNAQRGAFEESATRAASAFAEQNESLKNVGRESSALMNEAKKNLQDGLSNIDDKVKSMSSVVQQELERFRLEYQQNLTGFFDKQANLLEKTLGEQREGLAGVVEDFRSAFKEENEIRRQQYLAIDQQHTQLKEGVSLVEELIEAVGMNKAGAFSQLEDASKAISAQVGMLRRSYEEAATRFNRMTEQMPEAMNGYFEKAKVSNERFFDNFDEAAAQVHGKLADAANLLVTAMQQIEMQLIEEKVS
ncbi:MotA/TolQ/ExbB proton channel family protein [Motiliproteus sp. SC1-56]|uniref:MotA/TolQ/ExbB proton channel family protein n=1 Tax=Motiliproteus sp. SC1-56 TaxID=2799565 RepID=UPI001A8FDBC7|nr:MotA/TolQ/ExbB proton channel family protein [Motiliproteus sp. SC1-56]